MFWKYLLLLFQIRSERDTPSSGWQPQAELSEVTKKSECNPIRSTFTTDTIFSFPCAYHQSRTPRYMLSGKTCRMRFFHPGKHPVRNKRFWGVPIIKVTKWIKPHPIYNILQTKKKKKNLSETNKSSNFVPWLFRTGFEQVFFKWLKTTRRS